MEELILFGLTFLLVFLIYEFFLIGPRKKKNNKKKELLEIKYMQARYHIDFDSKIYPQLLQICAIVSSLDISIIVWILSKIENLWLMMIIGFVSMLLFIVISYHFVYYFYKKKGMVKDGKHK